MLGSLPTGTTDAPPLTFFENYELLWTDCHVIITLHCLRRFNKTHTMTLIAVAYPELFFGSGLKIVLKIFIKNGYWNDYKLFITFFTTLKSIVWLSTLICTWKVFVFFLNYKYNLTCCCTPIDFRNTFID